MKNPFEEFHGAARQSREIPLDKILQSKEETLSRILRGYEDLLKNEAKDLVWLMQYSTVIKAYTIAEKGIEGIEYTAEDIEEFCYALDRTDQIPYLITGPAGVYISALCNHAKEDEIVLRLQDLNVKINLLGYRLPPGKRVVVEGNVGDFTGIGLDGGELVIEGSTKNYTGAGMKRGKIVVRHNVGFNTGHGMTGGEIIVGGRIKGLGKIVGGKVYERDHLVFPSEGIKPFYF
ncbi:MAG: hypothetical protein DRG32_03590 [Deltaproteobacteria bacterium]|nr:MAG: hypothetical protein DRG40_01130 [Deltaproteobacteria bacterium]RLA97456.1 MAG: hypothetical protein DRG32_03590 [Deltaproteobacteria bacterium]